MQQSTHVQKHCGSSPEPYEYGYRVCTEKRLVPQMYLKRNGWVQQERHAVVVWGEVEDHLVVVEGGVVCVQWPGVDRQVEQLLWLTASIVGQQNHHQARRACDRFQAGTGQTLGFPKVGARVGD